jgi:hypothetical protein
VFVVHQPVQHGGDDGAIAQQLPSLRRDDSMSAARWRVRVEIIVLLLRLKLPSLSQFFEEPQQDQPLLF